MSQNWQAALEKLKNYISSNPSITIEPSTVVIPGETRAGFYAAFDDARQVFIEEYFPVKLQEVRELSLEFNAVAEKVQALLGLEEQIQLEPRLNWLINDPLNGMMRSLYDPLFDLLKGKIEDEDFLASALEEIETRTSHLYAEGYKIWVLLSLVAWLEPSDLLFVSQKVPNGINSLTELYKSGERIEPVPDPVKTSEITFFPGTWDTFFVPDLIIFSRKLNRYAALRRNLPVNTNEPYLVAKQRSNRKEWLPFQPLQQVFRLTNPWPSLLVYTDEDPEHIRLIADCQVMLRPDLVISVKAHENLFDENQIFNINTHRQHLQPYSGTVVLSRNPVPQKAFDTFDQRMPNVEPVQDGGKSENLDGETAVKISETVTLVSIGFDSAAAGRILEVLVSEL